MVPLTNKTLIKFREFTYILQPSKNTLSWDTWKVLKMISVLQLPALEFGNNPKNYIRKVLGFVIYTSSSLTYSDPLRF